MRGCIVCGSNVGKDGSMFCSRCSRVLSSLPFSLRLVDMDAISYDARGRMLCGSLSGEWYRWNSRCWKKVG